MENVLNGTPKATYYLNELASELSALIIDKKYENTGVNTMVQKGGSMVYSGHIQYEYDDIYDEVFQYLQSNQIK
jgi:hypothetical protein